MRYLMLPRSLFSVGFDSTSTNDIILEKVGNARVLCII